MTMPGNYNKLHNTPPQIEVLIYLLVLVFIHAGSQISLITQHDLAVSDYYLPTALSLILVNWLGPKYVLPVVYLNAVCTSYLWGTPVERWPFWFLYAIPETLYCFLSWYFFRVIYRGKFWLPDLDNTIAFLVAGIFIPVVIETFLLQLMLVWSGDQSITTFWAYIKSNLLAELTNTFCLILPVLYFFTPVVQRYGFLYDNPPDIHTIKIPSKRTLIALLVIFTILLGFVFLIDFKEFWYVYGLFSLYVAIRFGFGPALITNFYILLITYLFPKFIVGFAKNDIGDYNDVSNIFLGANLLFAFAAILGRVMSDVRLARANLIRKNAELEQTNKELDRFVYSVSHDLSAPLKSILGLVNISRLDNDTYAHTGYLNRIEQSVIKLERFINEILDYSKNKRQELVIEQIHLKTLCDEILDNLRYTPEFKALQIDFRLEQADISQDKVRLKIILNNFLTNAVKFQKKYEDHKPYVKISSYKYGDDVRIEIEDNGEGIKVEQHDKIFEMFYRGHKDSDGSGLGLYIAKETASKIQGNIFFQSEYGKGSTFGIQIKNLRTAHAV